MFAIEVGDPSQVAEARQRASSAAASSGFDAVRVGEVALAATELSTNLIKHAQRGELIVNAEDERLELLALDRGPGMANIAACLADGYSTAGTRGAGLGAVRRLAQTFEITSWPGRGTVVFAAVARNGKNRPAARSGPRARPRCGVSAEQRVRARGLLRSVNRERDSSGRKARHA